MGMNNTALVTGSIGAISQRTGASLAETFVNADVVILVDVSGSMSDTDSRGGRSRYDVACEELAILQNGNPGKIAVLAFSNNTIFVPTGQPPLLGGGTDLAGALKFAKMADTGDMRFVVISDGEPADQGTALSEAAQYKGRIDVVYVGPEERPSGREFLRRLAALKGGQTVTADKAQQLASKTQTLLLAQ
jgi:hypothetical protein